MFLICQQTGKNKNGIADLELYKKPVHTVRTWTP